MLKLFPLPVFTLSVLCIVSFLLFCCNVYGNYARGRLDITIDLHRKPLNILFLAVLIVNLILAFIIFKFYKLELQTAVPIADSRITDVLSGGDQLLLDRSFFTDFFSSLMALFAAFVSLVIGLRAMSDKISALTPLKASCILIVIASVEGIYYSNSLYSIFFFNLLSQFASYGLYHHARQEDNKVSAVLLHNLSRIISMVILLAGFIMLASKYGPSVTKLMSFNFESGLYERIAISLIIAPLLAFFLRPVSHTSDPVYRSFFVMRSQAVFYILLRIVFSVFGASAGLEKVPNIMIFTGCITIFFAVLMMISAREPDKNAVFMDMFTKGFLVVAAGIGYYGCFSAEGLARYGFTALECLIVLCLLYLPLFALLSLAVALIERADSDGVPLYKKRGLSGLTPVAVFTIFFVLLAFCCMPPMVTYPFMQLLLRGANFIWPFLAAFLVISIIAMFFTGLYMISAIAFGRIWTAEDKANCSVRDSEISLSAGILILWISLMTFVPGVFLQRFAAPSVEALTNTGYSIDVIEEAGK